MWYSFYNHTREPEPIKWIKVGNEEQERCSKAHFSTFIILFLIAKLIKFPLWFSPLLLCIFSISTENNRPDMNDETVILKKNKINSYKGENMIMI